MKKLSKILPPKPPIPKSKPPLVKISSKLIPPKRSSLENPETPSNPLLSYSLRFLGSDRTAYASAISLNFSSASGSLFLSG
ncbi:MAG: hypothetical protein U9Q33_05045 [Campylobacterota bacterium]|nr:hypothetical protein [Campylobacterota bacterium]